VENANPEPVKCARCGKQHLPGPCGITPLPLRPWSAHGEGLSAKRGGRAQAAPKPSQQPWTPGTTWTVVVLGVFLLSTAIAYLADALSLVLAIWVVIGFVAGCIAIAKRFTTKQLFALALLPVLILVGLGLAFLMFLFVYAGCKAVVG